MTFAAPSALIALAVVPGLVAAYVVAQRRRRRAAAAFASAALTASVVPRPPGWRRHVAPLAFVLGLALLILAAAEPRQAAAVPIHGSAFVLANDVSDSMAATDVRPTRLGAARITAARVVASLPGSALIGEMSFARHPTVLQSPTRDHALVQTAIRRLTPAGGGTAIGATLTTATHILAALRTPQAGRPPAAIVLLSDGGENVGANPVIAARRARAAHIPVDVIAIGTRRGVIPEPRHGRTVLTPVPVAPTILDAIARASGGRALSASDLGEARAIGTHLTARLGHRRVERSLVGEFVGGALVLVAAGAGLSLTSGGLR